MKATPQLIDRYKADALHMSDQALAAWRAVYKALQAGGLEYYFDNGSGFRRCRDDAQAGDERAMQVWALYMAERMKG